MLLHIWVVIHASISLILFLQVVVRLLLMERQQWFSVAFYLSSIRGYLNFTSEPFFRWISIIDLLNNNRAGGDNVQNDGAEQGVPGRVPGGAAAAGGRAGRRRAAAHPAHAAGPARQRGAPRPAHVCTHMFLTRYALLVPGTRRAADWW